jgi:hypothetical protein
MNFGPGCSFGFENEAEQAAFQDDDNDDQRKGRWSRQRLSTGTRRWRLLAKDSVDPDAKGKDARTPLSCATEKRHVAVVQLF